MSSLYVLIPPDPARADSDFPYVLSPDGRAVAAHASATAARLPAATGAAAEVVVVLPAEALSWHRVQLPKGVGPGSSRLRPVLEGLLEDHLLDEPEALHFALAPQPRPGEPVWVAVCQRAWLRACLNALEAAGRPVSRVVPEIAPEAPGGLRQALDARTGVRGDRAAIGRQHVGEVAVGTGRIRREQDVE